MDEHRIRGGVKEAAGRVQNAAGGLLGDTRTQINGKFREVAGQAESAYGEALDSIESIILERPLPTLGVALGVGFLVGLLLSARR